MNMPARQFVRSCGLLTVLQACQRCNAPFASCVEGSMGCLQ